MSRSAILVAAIVCSSAASAAPAEGRDAFLRRLAGEVRARLDAAIAARAPRLVPPRPIAVQWKMTRIGTLELGAPLAALAAADLDGDGRAELYAVTSREVIAIGLRGKKLEELGRVAFGGEPAVPASRDVVGTAIIAGGELVAAVSSWARELRVGWRRDPAAPGGRTLAADPGEPGFLVCPGERVALARGRNYFGDAAAGRYASRCRADLVDPDGHPLRVRGEVSLAGKLEVAVERCAPGGVACQPIARHEYAPAGFAFEVADVDRDGRLEAILTGAGPPGEPDALRVITLGDDEKKARVRKAFSAGGVAGVAAADLDGDGAQDVVAAVRLTGATRVDVWRLE